MSTVNRVDQAMLLLKERLRRLDGRAGGATTSTGKSDRSERGDTLAPIRQLARRGGIADGEMRRALVRTLLADSLGEELVGSLEFQSIADQVTRMLEESETGRALLVRVLAELQ